MYLLMAIALFCWCFVLCLMCSGASESLGLLLSHHAIKLAYHTSSKHNTHIYPLLYKTLTTLSSLQIQPREGPDHSSFISEQVYRARSIQGHLE